MSRDMRERTVPPRGASLADIVGKEAADELIDQQKDWKKRARRRLVDQNIGVRALGLGVPRSSQ